MLRRLLTFAAAASLVLCVATCVLWVRSYWYVDSRYDSTGDVGWTAYSLELDRGRIVYLRSRNPLKGEPYSDLATHRKEPELRWMFDDIRSTARTMQPRDYYSPAGPCLYLARAFPRSRRHRGQPGSRRRGRSAQAGAVGRRLP